MNYKMIASDLDGTLLNNKKEITPHTLEIIHRAISKGLIFVISTGRATQGMEMYQSVLNLDTPAITYNGAVISHTRTKEVLFEQGLLREDARRLLQMGKERGTTMCIWSKGQLYGNVLNERIYDYKKLSGVEPLLMESEEELLDQGITKILWYDTESNIQLFRKDMEHTTFDHVTTCLSTPVFLEFFHNNVSKALSLDRIANMYGISPSEILAVGDAENDLSMLEYAGLGVAMANADREVKEKADYIAASNEEDGVAGLIEQFFLSEI